MRLLKAWLISPEHFHHPYPTAEDQARLMAQTGIDKKQLKNWFTNARRRIWKPLVRDKAEREGAEAVRSDSPRFSDDTMADAPPSLHSGGSSPRPTPGGVSPRTNGVEGSHALASSERVNSSSFLDLLADDDGADDGDSDRARSPRDGDDGSFRRQRSSTTASDDTQFTTDLRASGVGPRSRKRSFADSEDLESPGGGEACPFCGHRLVDTRLAPCGHRFHASCLRPWLEATVTTPVCPQCTESIVKCVHVGAPKHNRRGRSRSAATEADVLSDFGSF